MNKNVTWKTVVVFLVCLWGIYYAIPNFIKNEDSNTKVKKYNFLPNMINYGLDIQGGLHLVMGVDVNEVVNESLYRMGTSIKDKVKEKNIEVSNVQRQNDSGSIAVEFKNQSEVETAKSLIEKDFTGLQVVKSEGNKVEVRYLDNYVRDLKHKTVEQSIETIRNRVDEFGVAEPSITAQGDDRILVQLPGLKDAVQAKELINKTAKLEFMIVSKNADMAKISEAIQKAEKDGNYSLQDTKYSEYIKKINKDLASILPKNTKLLFQKAENAESMLAAKVPYVVETGLDLTGQDLKSASTMYGEFGEPEVSLNFSSVGATKFADITASHVGSQLAVVLDEVIYTAPNIKERIGGGSARITLGRGKGGNYDSQLKEANLISMALRAGALPARLEQLEERTVGPSLGSDSISSAQKAIVAGVVLIAIFMIVYYKILGLIAIISLLFNGVLILATLSSFGATLTLPGIAGIGLTLGMAIDANVIIYERIREELRRGMDIVAATNEGFNRAMSAILDANIVVAATSAILMYYGTGPVRGFGLTLLIGIGTTLFTAVFMTRTIVEFLIYKMNIRKLSV